MSGDLISRKAVIDLIESCHVFEDAYCLVDYINELPTAYDVDKVMEQLESVSIPENKVLYASPDEFAQFLKLKDAIEIIKSGGIK
jgi:hypothetical protein